MPTEPGKIDRILVIQLKHLGDVLLSTPVLDALREKYPAAKIQMLVNSGMEPMVEGHPALAGVISLQREKRLARLGAEWRLLRRLRAERFDLVINLSRGDRGGWLSVLCGARWRLGYKVASQEPARRNWFYNLAVDQPTESIHEVEKNLRLLSALGTEPKPRPLLFAVPSESASWAERTLQPVQCAPRGLIHVHPTSRWMFKSWNAEKVAGLVRSLQSQGHAVIMSCGPHPDELAYCERVLKECKPELQFLGTLELKALGALISKADAFFGVDSAPMHIAAAVGTPTVALFGPTGSENWSPWMVESRVLQESCPCKEARAQKCDWTKGSIRQCLAAISVEEALAALGEIARTPAGSRSA